MSTETSVELTESDAMCDEKQKAISTPEKRTVPSLADVQTFCLEFHVKVENASGIRPWLQFSDTHFPGNKIEPRIIHLSIFAFILKEKVLKQFEEHEFDIPTPIQSITWPILTENRDLVGIISSGSGRKLSVS